MVGVYHHQKLTRAAGRLAELLHRYGKPVLPPFDFFRLVCRLYDEPTDSRLYLRQTRPDRQTFIRLRTVLKHQGVIAQDRDYGTRVIRVYDIADRPAEDIICLTDPTCYVSHLSAMHRWGLTMRSSRAVMLTRPDRKSAMEMLKMRRIESLGRLAADVIPLTMVKHPLRVRGRPVRILETKTAGASLPNRGTEMRLASIGQTFLDMVKAPKLCGGMPHVLEVWDEHAKTHLDAIISAVDACDHGLAKCRAGYILSERLKLSHSQFLLWQSFAQRGGSRKLDPTKIYSPTYSDNWMLSINV